MKRTTLLFVCLASACAASIAQSSDPSQIPSHKSRIRSLPGRIAAPVDWAKLKAGGQIKQYAKPSAATVLTHDEQGRVTQVLEPDAQGQPTIETDIAYDANGKILSIVQHGAQGDSARIRSFTYDAQSRVTSATSPEAGTIA
jgi:YD repeat-containing protein